MRAIVIAALVTCACATAPATPQKRFSEDVLEYGNVVYSAPAGDVYLAMVLGLSSLGYTLDTVDMKKGIVITRTRSERSDALTGALAGKLVKRSVEVHVLEMKGSVK